jgi:surface antigen
MAWETRNGGGRYYTRSKRVHGRVVREYIGTGPAAEMIAALDAESQRERDERRTARKASQAELERSAALVDRSWKGVLGITRAVLVVNGYYRHHRGEWRKRRV